MALIRQSLLSKLISGSLLRQSLPFELTLGGKLVRDHNAASIVTVPGGTQTLPNDSASGLPAFTQANPARHLTVGATNGIPWFQSVDQGDDADADWLVTASNFDIRKTDIFGLVMQTGGEAFIMGDVVNRRFGFSNGRLRTVKIFETGADDGNRTGAETHAYNRWYVIHARLAESGNSFIRSFGHGLDGNGPWAELDRITFDGGVRTNPTNMPYFMGSVFSDATGTPRGTAIRANRALVYTHALGIPTDTQVNLLIGVLRSTVDTLRLSFSEIISVQASNGEATPIVTGISILSNDPSATSVASVNGAAAPWAASIAGSNGGVFTIGTDGAATFDPGTDFAYDVLGTARSTAFTYTTNLGGGATFTAQVAGGFEPAYVLAPQTDATFYDELGVDKVLLSGHLSIEATVVGTMTRTPGAVGTAHLVFADDAASLMYPYAESPPVDYVGVSLAILVPAGITSGRVVETAAVGGGYFRVEVIGDDLRVEIFDGEAGHSPIGISRALPARDEVFGFTAALGSGGLFLALSGDTASTVVNASRDGYDAPIAETLRIGGAGAHLYGGQLASPADFTAAEAATAAAGALSTYAVTGIASLFAGDRQGVWYDPFTNSTLNQVSTNDGDAADEDNDPVGYMADRSGRGNHARQTIASKRPTYKTGPARLALDRVDDLLLVVVPSGGWTGTMVLGTNMGTASYGVAISATDMTDAESIADTSYEIGGFYDGARFPGNALVAQVIRNGAMSAAEKAVVEAAMVENGAVASYGAVIDFSSFWSRRTDIVEFPLIDVSSGTRFRYTWFNNRFVSFPALTLTGDFFEGAWNNCVELTTFPPNMFDNITGGNFLYAFNDTNLTEASIDNILVSLVTSGIAAGSRRFDQSGGSAPSVGTGRTAIDTLRARDWTITVTGGY
jgi:hypothetical protein